MAKTTKTPEQIKRVAVSKLVLNENNPRLKDEEGFKKLLRSLEEFPDMLGKRPIIVDEDMVVLGGNMRLMAAVELGMKTVPVLVASGWTDEQKREFIIKDNLSYGAWDWDKLLTWDTPELGEWGLEVPSYGDISKLDTVNKGEEDDEWVGMPEFEKKEPTLKIIVHFENEHDREKFAKKHELEFLKKQEGAWSTNYPYTGRDDLKSMKHE